jgi:hypothetical protein
MSPHPDLSRAAEFVWRTARLVDRARFAHLFLGGPREAVTAAVRAYQNPDGGFGHALEPDLRAPDSQPGATRAALELLAEAGALDDPMVARACDHLVSIAAGDGGLPSATAAAARYPRAPWWQPSDAASPVFSGLIAALLERHRVAHPVRGRLAAYCWRQVAAFDPPDFTGRAWELPRVGAGYEARALLAFLDAVDDPRRDGALARLGARVRERGLVELDPRAPGEVHRPLDYAPSPRSAGRALFSDGEIAAHLDALAAGQREDGGWMFSWADWNPASTLEWRGWLTVETLVLLRAYGR